MYNPYIPFTVWYGNKNLQLQGCIKTMAYGQQWIVMCIPFFFGPLHITASSGEESRNPTDITQRLSCTYWSTKNKKKYHFTFFSHLKIINKIYNNNKIIHSTMNWKDRIIITMYMNNEISRVNTSDIHDYYTAAGE